jgi:CMP-N-acetylneuraminic acid synthetase
MMVLALIPARGGSKGIPRKNIRPFCGKPLLQWAIDVALVGAFVDQVVDSTDDPGIAEVVDIDTPLDWKWAELLMEQQA